MNENYKRTRAYLEALERGRAGERYLYDELSNRLRNSGLVIRVMTEDNHTVPFDLEVLDGNRIIADIENKDLTGDSRGTEITKSAKRRKLEYAREHGVKLLLTTVTRRSIGAIGFKEGLVNGHPMVFDYDVTRLVSKIIDARGAT